MNTGSPVRSAPRFEAEYAPLRSDRRELGDVSVLPWDTEIFGFSVADYRPGPAGALFEDRTGLERTLAEYAEQHGVELIGCRVPVDSAGAAAALASAGFRFVELQLRATLPRLDAGRLDPPRLTVRAAERADHAGIADIAGTAFAFGRYHADPYFPRPLASRRFRVWMERALAEPSPGTWIGVLGPPGEPVGFVHTEREGAVGDFRLLAADPAKAAFGGPALLLGALHTLAAAGATRATARLSAANVAALNVYASLHFQFHEPEVVLHWTRPGGALRSRFEG